MYILECKGNLSIEQISLEDLGELKIFTVILKLLQICEVNKSF